MVNQTDLFDECVSTLYGLDQAARISPFNDHLEFLREHQLSDPKKNRPLFQGDGLDAGAGV